MPPIWCKAVFKGEKGEIEAEALLNSGSDVIVLPRELALKIRPKFAGNAVFELADGRVIRRKVYEIEVGVANEETGEIRKAKVHTTIEKRGYPLIGTAAMEKLRIIPDVIRGKVSFV
jgi:predicted aspartyl protease